MVSEKHYISLLNRNHVHFKLLNKMGFQKDKTKRVDGKMRFLLFIATCFSAVILISSCRENIQNESLDRAGGNKSIAAIRGLLRIHPSNPRYFTDDSSKAIYLTGSHTWLNLQDRGASYPPPPFDYEAYLDFMESHNHNFMRMWAWEESWGIVVGTEERFHDPMVYQNVSPQSRIENKPKFDLDRLNQGYFNRLRQRVIAARDRGIYVSIMLFQGWSIEKKQKGRNTWQGHPYNINNNVNQINGDPNGDGEGSEVHTLLIPAVIKLQETYVRKVVDTVNDLDNVLYEIANEDSTTPENTAWQYHMIKYIHNYQERKSKRHPVLMTWPWPPGQNNNKLFASPAEAISPGWGGHWKSSIDDYRSDPPAADGRKVIITDTDHLWGIGGDHQWVWKSFLRGLNPIFMDPYRDERYQEHHSRPGWELIRKNMGYTLTYARKMNLSSMVPQNDLCSTKYCLANSGQEYLIYLPSQGHRGLGRLDSYRFHKWINWFAPFNASNETAIVDLSGSSETFRVEWFNPRTGETTEGGSTEGGTKRSFRSPFTGDAVLYIYRVMKP